jgi:hypothetical protein
MTALTLTLTPRPTTLPCSTNPEAWYDPDQETTAKQGCMSCPARDTCLTLAQSTNEPWGVWGGYNPIERDRLTAGMPARSCAGCGTTCVPQQRQIARCDQCTNSGRHINEQHDHIARLAADGLTDPEIAARLGCKVWQVKECRKKHDIPSRYPNGGGYRRQVADLAPCGTYAAYRRHKRRGEPVDAGCEMASRRRSQDMRKGARSG